MKKIFLYLPIVLLFGCNTGSGDSFTELTGWDKVKNDAYVEVALTGEFQSAASLGIATLGWEDGLNVSRNGLYLYATYLPADMLSWVLAAGTPDTLPDYARGPEYDMDFINNPAAVTYLWYHSDIIISSRASINDSFPAWTTSNMKRHSYSEGAVSAVFSSDHAIDTVAFTSNEDYTNQNNIRIITSTTADPSGTGADITAVLENTINSSHIEDNPHLEKLGANNWVLFFDSDDRPSGEGSHDIWFSTSSDNGANWSIPENASTVNTAAQNHQPHLYNDGTDWWLYYSQPHSDGKLAIFRSRQGTANDWDSWQTPDLVISAGNTMGVGEPTLTDGGDLFFVAVLENPDGNSTNRFDADPWMAMHK